MIESMYEVSMEIYMRNGGTHYEITYRYPRIACPYDISVPARKPAPKTKRTAKQSL